MYVAAPCSTKEMGFVDFPPPVSEVSHLRLLYSQGTRRVAAVSYRVMVISQTHSLWDFPSVPTAAAH